MSELWYFTLACSNRCLFDGSQRIYISNGIRGDKIWYSSKNYVWIDVFLSHANICDKYKNKFYNKDLLWKIKNN